MPRHSSSIYRFSKPVTGPSFIIVPNNKSINEGSDVVFTVTKYNTTIKTLYWQIDSTMPANKFKNSVTSGVVAINDSTATFTISTVYTVATEQTTNFRIILRTTSPANGPIVLTSDYITVTNTIIPVTEAQFTKPGKTVWTVPSGVSSINIVAIGGGGGGGGTVNLLVDPKVGSTVYGARTAFGGGGGGGALAYKNNVTVSSGDTITINIGSGGGNGWNTGGYYASGSSLIASAGVTIPKGTAGFAGGDTTIVYKGATIVSAGGGKGGGLGYYASPAGGDAVGGNGGSVIAGDGGGAGGKGGNGDTSPSSKTGVSGGGGGGGAGGYSGSGGNGGNGGCYNYAGKSFSVSASDTHANGAQGQSSTGSGGGGGGGGGYSGSGSTAGIGGASGGGTRLGGSGESGAGGRGFTFGTTAATMLAPAQGGVGGIDVSTTFVTPSENIRNGFGWGGGGIGVSGGNGAVRIKWTVVSTSYTITPNVTSINESGSVVFTIATTGLPDSTLLYWTTTGTVTKNRFSTNTDSGFVIINSNLGKLTRTVINNALVDGATNFSIVLRTGSTTGPIVATSASVTVNDTSTA